MPILSYTSQICIDRIHNTRIIRKYQPAYRMMPRLFTKATARSPRQLLGCWKIFLWLISRSNYETINKNFANERELLPARIYRSHTILFLNMRAKRGENLAGQASLKRRTSPHTAPASAWTKRDYPGHIGLEPRCLSETATSVATYRKLESRSA